MVPKILCISIASKSTFSHSDHIIDRFRNFIKFENAKALFYLKNWLFGENR